jgi:hypothetical protein
MYIPESMSSARGSKGRKNTHAAGSLPAPMAMKMAATIAMNMSDTQR